MTATGDTARRGYDWQHERARIRFKRLVDAGQAFCARCGAWIDPTTPWDLDHDDNDRRYYRGVSHRRCNRTASTTPQTRAAPEAASGGRVLRRLKRHSTSANASKLSVFLPGQASRLLGVGFTHTESLFRGHFFEALAPPTPRSRADLFIASKNSGGLVLVN